MSTEDTPKPAGLPDPDTHCWDDDTNNDVWSYSQGLMRATIDAAVAAANARWERALGAVMPADFKCWHQNEKSELPEIAAGVIENLRQKEADAWDQLAAAVSAERERCARICEQVSAEGRMLGGEDAHAFVCAERIRAPNGLLNGAP